MFERLAIVVALLTVVLTACASLAPATPTPQPPPATTTKIPPTGTPTPEAGILTYEQALPLFDYDASPSFNLHVSSESEKDGIIVQEIAYLAANADYTPKTAGKIVAYLVKPSKSGSYAGILYL